MSVATPVPDLSHSVRMLGCPTCEVELRAGKGDALECPKCRGLFISKAPPDLPDGSLLALARNASGRCRNGHGLSRAMRLCICGAAPLGCPRCEERLAMVEGSGFAVAFCARCRGLWLDPVSREHADPVQIKGALKRAKQGEWEIPPSSAPGKDPWLTALQRQPVAKGHTGEEAYRTPFDCRICGRALTSAESWAYDGEIYCQVCRPPAAVSGTSALERAMETVRRTIVRWLGPTQ